MSTLMLEAVKITQSLASKSLFQLTHPRQHPYCVLAKINSFTARAKISLYDVNHESCENGANELQIFRIPKTSNLVKKLK